MTTVPNYYQLFAARWTDMQRADAFDAWEREQPEDIRHAVGYKLFALKDAGLTDMEAKVLLSMLTVFLNCPPLDRADMVARGEAIVRARDWEVIDSRRRVRQMAEV
jgi:hypothetical protein